MSMSWRDSTAPMSFIVPRQGTTELPFVAHWVKSQPAPKPQFKQPLWRFIVSLAITLGCFAVPVVGLALMFGK